MSSDALGLRASNIGLTFPDGFPALDAVDLTVAPGSFAALLGPSGCGKTTLLRIIGGLASPTTGQVSFVNGEGGGGGDVATVSADFGFCFQEPRLLPWRTVLGNVALPLELTGVDEALRTKAAREMLDRVGLAGACDLRPHQLSGGMQMRAAIARAWVTRPRVLLLDEPFGALDEITRGQLDDELARIWEGDPTTVILVTHSIAEAVSLADRVHVMSPTPGRILESIDVNFPERGAAARKTRGFQDKVAQAYDVLEAGLQ